MKKLITFLILPLFLFANTVFAKRVLKVRGKTAYLSTKGLYGSKGDVLSVYADGYKVGKVRLVKMLKRKFWVAKVISGDPAKGDYVKVKKGKRGKRGRSRYRSKKGWFDSFYVGAGILSLDGGQPVQDNNGVVIYENGTYPMHKAFTLGYDKKINLFNKPFMLMLHGIMSFGGVKEYRDGANGETLTNFNSNYLELNADFAYTINHMFYIKFGLGASQTKASANVTQATSSFVLGDYSETFTGANFGIGGGLKYDLGPKFAIKFDLAYRTNFFFSGSATRPASDPNQAQPCEDDPSTPENEGGCGGQQHINALLSLGYKF